MCCRRQHSLFVDSHSAKSSLRRRMALLLVVFSLLYQPCVHFRWRRWSDSQYCWSRSRVETRQSLEKNVIVGVLSRVLEYAGAFVLVLCESRYSHQAYQKSSYPTHFQLRSRLSRLLRSRLAPGRNNKERVVPQRPKAAHETKEKIREMNFRRCRSRQLRSGRCEHLADPDLNCLGVRVG